MENETQAQCPNCNYCKHCGRSDRPRYYPVYPQYPVYPYIPYQYRPVGPTWAGTEINWEIKTANNDAVLSAMGGSRQQ